MTKHAKFEEKEDEHKELSDSEGDEDSWENEEDNGSNEEIVDDYGASSSEEQEVGASDLCGTMSRWTSPVGSGVGFVPNGASMKMEVVVGLTKGETSSPWERNLKSRECS